MLSDVELLAEVKRLTAIERQATARLIAALGELDARRLYLSEGCSSLFTYCTQVLHLSEHAAYLRIEAARAARKWPAILELLAEGALHLTAIGLLAPHLTTDNIERTLAAARHKSKREVEEIVAAAAASGRPCLLGAEVAGDDMRQHRRSRSGSHPPQESARTIHAAAPVRR